MKRKIMEPKTVIAAAIKRERERANLSLSALAKEAGLAKSTLSQLEAGNGNPNIETLWAIASCLKIPFSFLFENTTPQHHLIRAHEGEQISSEMAGYSAVLLDKSPPNRLRDIYRVNIRKGEIRQAAPHPSGTVEHVIITSGKIRIGPVNMTEDLNVGDYYRFPADTAHMYECLSETATLIMVTDSPA